MTISELSYAVIGTADLASWRDYGVKVLGMQAANAIDGSLYLRMDGRDFRLLVVESERECLAASGWRARGKGEFETVRASVEAAGFKTVAGTEEETSLRRVQEYFSFSDPDGLVQEVSWGPIAAFEKFVSPQGTRFVTGDLGLGHVVLPVANLEAAVAFWTNVMGFGISDLLKIPLGDGSQVLRMYFLHCEAGRQHSLALAEIENPTGCVHMMVEVDSMDEVGLALDRAERHGVKMATTLGKHINDDMISFYMLTPGGFQLEYGTGGAVMNWTNYKIFESTRPSYWGHKWLLG